MALTSPTGVIAVLRNGGARDQQRKKPVSGAIGAGSLAQASQSTRQIARSVRGLAGQSDPPLPRVMPPIRGPLVVYLSNLEPIHTSAHGSTGS